MDDKKRRKLERHHLVFYLRVFTQSDRQVLGHVVDISAEGMMLLSDTPIEIDKNYSVTMRLPMDKVGKGDMSFDVLSCWCREDTNPDFFLSGFKIEEIDSKVAGYIRHLVDEFGF